MEALKITSVSKTYQNGNVFLRALDNISFTVDKGEFVAITGTSESRKSTLLNIIGGLDYPTNGCISVNGINLLEFNKEELTEFRRRNIGFVFQNYNLIPVLNAFENIVLPVKLDKITVDEVLVHKIVAALNIKEQLYQMPSTMSGGQQQRIAIARALYRKPAIVLADEPTGNLDSKNSKEVMQLMKKMKEEFEQTMIVVTHDNQVAEIADWVIRIEDGKVCG